MLRKFQTKTKLLFPILTLGAIFTVLVISIMTSQYSQIHALDELKKGVHLSTKISKIIHQLQKERGMTAGYLSSNGEKFKILLTNQRVLVDKELKNFNKYLEIMEDKTVKKSLKIVLEDINNLYIKRENIDKLKITVPDAIAYYTNMDKHFLDVIGSISQISVSLDIKKNIDAYQYFLYAKENTGIERAVGISILTTKHFNNEMRIEFIKLISVENLYINHFLEYSSPESKTYYLEHFRGKAIETLKKDREKILNLNLNVQSVQVDPYEWFSNMTKKINRLKEVDNYLAKEIINNIHKEYEKTELIFYIFLFLSIFSMIIFVFTIYVILKLIEHERRLKTMIDKYVISSTSDTKGTIIEASEAYSTTSGYSIDELLGKQHNITRHPDMDKETFAQMWETIQSGKIWRGKIKNRKKDGGYYWVDANVEPLFDKHGNIEGYTAIRLNITDSMDLQEKLQKQAQKSKEQKEYLNTVIESSNGAIIAIDENSKILTYNRKAEEIFQFSKEEMLENYTVYGLITQRYRNLFDLAFKAYFEDGRKRVFSKTIELDGLRKDGSIVPIRVSFGVSDTKVHKIIVANIIDLTREKQQDQLLKQQSKLAQMGEMISMIAHQWRQPLNAISLTSGIIRMKAQRGKLDNEKAIELSTNIADYSHHLSETINDFRDFFKSEKKSEETSYPEIISSVLKIIEESIVNKKIELIKNFHCDDRFVSYPNELKQVVLNLIKNAEDILIEKEVKDPYIKIQTYKINNRFVLEVSDNGGGIPKAIINNVFDPYFSTKTQKDGTGLGLYMSKTIIEQHCNGELSVTNNEAGAVFKVILNKNF